LCDETVGGEHESARARRAVRHHAAVVSHPATRAMSRRNLAAVLLTIVSLGLLVPGLTRPILTITANIAILGVTREIFRETQSIVQSVQRLHDSDNTFVAALILLFSIMVPVIKAVLLLVLLRLRTPATQFALFRFVRSISKWSMADVFVVGVFIAFLAADALDNLSAVAGEGLYWFAGYCLVSNLAFQVLLIPDPAHPTR
jgi:paraquat-inducible protein A